MVVVVTPTTSVTVSLSRQWLEVRRGGELLAACAVSTSRFGPGEQAGSLCTPRGQHLIRARIGAGLPEGAVLRARRPTGEICTPEAYAADPRRDWILTRILWLSGAERGHNRLGRVDTMRRFIYIHGAPDAVPMGVPFSRGCIRMRNIDVIWLFDMVRVGTPVTIVP